MAIAAVQRVAKSANATSVAIGSGDGWSAPTAGNLLVFSANSDATVTLSGAGTVSNGPSIIDGNGAYTWYKIAATGSETTITGTPSVSDDIVLTCCEYSGVSAFDVSNSSTIAASLGSTTTAAAVTTTAAADLVLAFALLHAMPNGGSTPTSPTWSNSFVNQLNSASPGSTSTRCVTFMGELLPAGAAGSYSTAASWTNQISDRQQITLAFKASAGGSAASLVIPRRPARGLYMR